MTTTKTTIDGKNALALEGRLDTTTAPEFQATLLSALGETDDLVLDFKELVYVSSAGLRTLLMGQKTAQAKGGKMEIINVSAEIMEVFEMTGFSNILSIK